MSPWTAKLAKIETCARRIASTHNDQREYRNLLAGSIIRLVEELRPDEHARRWLEYESLASEFLRAILEAPMNAQEAEELQPTIEVAKAAEGLIDAPMEVNVALGSLRLPFENLRRKVFALRAARRPKPRWTSGPTRAPAGTSANFDHVDRDGEYGFAVPTEYAKTIVDALMKLASVAVHAGEYLREKNEDMPDANALMHDEAALQAVLDDPDVRAWIALVGPLAPLPRKS